MAGVIITSAGSRQQSPRMIARGAPVNPPIALSSRIIAIIGGIQNPLRSGQIHLPTQMGLTVSKLRKWSTEARVTNRDLSPSSPTGTALPRLLGIVDAHVPRRANYSQGFPPKFDIFLCNPRPTLQPTMFRHCQNMKHPYTEPGGSALRRGLDSHLLRAIKTVHVAAAESRTRCTGNYSGNRAYLR